jgi:hypothetical protein
MEEENGWKGSSSLHGRKKFFNVMLHLVQMTVLENGFVLSAVFAKSI